MSQINAPMNINRKFLKKQKNQINKNLATRKQVKWVKQVESPSIWIFNAYSLPKITLFKNEDYDCRKTVFVTISKPMHFDMSRIGSDFHIW